MAAPQETVTRIAEWVGLPAEDDAVRWAIAKSDFSHMSKMETDEGLKLFDKVSAFVLAYCNGAVLSQITIPEPSKPPML